MKGVIKRGVWYLKDKPKVITNFPKLLNTGFTVFLKSLIISGLASVYAFP